MRLSPSKLTLYGLCGEAFRREIIEGETQPLNPPMVRGRGTHRSAEVNYRQKLVTWENLAMDEIQDIARDYVVSETDGREIIDLDRTMVSRQQLIGESVDASARLAKAYHLAVGSTTQPKRVEEKIELDVGRGIVLVQIIDVQDVNDVVSDIKTSEKKKTQREADTSPQLTMQWAAIRAMDKKNPPYVRLDVAIDSKEPHVQSLVSQRSMEDVEVLLNLVNVTSSGIASGTFIPAALSGSWKCNPKYCGFYSTCKYVSKR